MKTAILAESGDEARSTYGQTTATSGIFEAFFGMKMEPYKIDGRKASGFKLKKMKNKNKSPKKHL